MSDREFGMGRGQVFPAASARSLLNPLRRLVQSPVRTVAAMGLARTARVVEIGAGPGYFSPTIAATVADGQLVVVDLQFEMVRLARQRLEGRPNAVFVVADVMRLPFRATGVDSVVVATVLGEVPEPTRCLEEGRAILRDGGTMVVAETRRDSDFIGYDRLVELAAPSGLVPIGKRGVRWQYVARLRATSQRP